MTCVKAREHKTKLLYTLNAFRSIQKRIALELRELASRDRVSFDAKVVQPKEKSSNNAFANSENLVVDDVIVTSADKEANVDVDDLIMDELVDINRFRLNGRMQS